MGRRRGVGCFYQVRWPGDCGPQPRRTTLQAIAGVSPVLPLIKILWRLSPPAWCRLQSVLAFPRAAKRRPQRCSRHAHSRSGESIPIRWRRFVPAKTNRCIKRHRPGNCWTAIKLGGHSAAPLWLILPAEPRSTGEFTLIPYGGTISGTVVRPGWPLLPTIIHVLRARNRQSVIGEGAATHQGLFKIPVIAKVGTTMCGRLAPGR